MTAGAQPITLFVKATFLHVEDADDSSPVAARRRSASWPPADESQSRRPFLIREGGAWRPPAEKARAEAAATARPKLRRGQFSSDTSTTPGSDEPTPAPTRGPSEDDFRTTVMMRNVPDVFSRSDLLALLSQEGYRAQIDFLYLPIDFRTGSNAGFAFVNLTSPDAAKKFCAHFARFSRWGVPAQKRCNVSWARDDQQGRSANIERYRNSSVMHGSVAKEHQPVLLADGQALSFPAPTRPLWPPHSDFGVRAARKMR
mmetsp:Transcript_117746/g.329729  ORF Transcript_117746/g.329729 Transcript_117746/m.329729 type:complete len:257 (-) Transcript_117746:112-882(-)